MLQGGLWMTMIASNFGWRVSTVVRGTRAVQECAMATRVAQRVRTSAAPPKPTGSFCFVCVEISLNYCRTTILCPQARGIVEQLGVLL